MNKYLITSAVGTGASELTSFDNALLNCKIANYNLVKVSSILPAHCKKTDKVDIAEGSVLFTAYAALSSEEKGRVISAAVGVGIPKDKNRIGVIMECSGFCTKAEITEKLKSMIKEAMDARGYEIDRIEFSAEQTAVGDKCATAFAALAMW